LPWAKAASGAPSNSDAPAKNPPNNRSAPFASPGEIMRCVSLNGGPAVRAIGSSFKRKYPGNNASSAIKHGFRLDPDWAPVFAIEYGSNLRLWRVFPKKSSPNGRRAGRPDVGGEYADYMMAQGATKASNTAPNRPPKS